MNAAQDRARSVRYVATPSGPEVIAAIEAGRLAVMTTPAQGNALPRGRVHWAADNGKFGKGWPGAEAWFAWLERQAAQYDPALCLFALAPDVPCDAAGTLAESLPWLPRIRALGLPAAFAAQNGCDVLGLPWDSFDVLFLAGGPEVPGDPRTEWKIGAAAQRLAAEAKARGKGIHMGRVNSGRRLAIAQWFGCDSADGTCLARGPGKNLRRVLGPLGALDHIPTLMNADS